jgi:hypothetical protein
MRVRVEYDGITERLVKEMEEDSKWKKVRVLEMLILSQDTISILFKGPPAYQASSGKRRLTLKSRELVEAMVASTFSLKEESLIEIPARVIIGGNTLRDFQFDWNATFPGKEKLLVHMVMNS